MKSVKSIRRKRVVRRKIRRVRKQRATLGWKNTVNMGTFFPKKVIATLPYTERVTLTSTTGTPAYYNFRANGIYDPNVTGAGHQPYGFDQYMALYDHFVVLGSKITMKIVPTTSSAVASHIGCFLNDDSSFTLTTPEAANEFPKSQYRILGAATDQVKTMKLTYSAKKVFGKAVSTADKLIGTSSADPSEQQYFSLAVQACDGSSTVAVNLFVRISYIVMFTELKDVAQS